MKTAILKYQGAAWLAALAVVCGLASCGADDHPEDKKNDPNFSATEGTPTPTPTPTTTPGTDGSQQQQGGDSQGRVGDGGTPASNPTSTPTVGSCETALQYSMAWKDGTMHYYLNGKLPLSCITIKDAIAYVSISADGNLEIVTPAQFIPGNSEYPIYLMTVAKNVIHGSLGDVGFEIAPESGNPSTYKPNSIKAKIKIQAP